MGASLGLLCSKTVSATLGGYIHVDGNIYMLTSEHFVAKSHANSAGDTACQKTLTSPSRYDLNDMENRLQQNMRDLYTEIQSLTVKTYGDREIPEQNFDAPELDEMKERMKGIESLHCQVTKPLREYTIGTHFRRSIEPRTAAIPKSLAEILGLDVHTIKHDMDWCLCEMNCPTGENRHKYSSFQEAMKDNYIDEKDRESKPGDICHETCDVESGLNVYYVGQGSHYRKGKVNVPTLVSIKGSYTHEWGIMSTEGEEIHYSQVAGDSGAWVIRENGNKLMGQVMALGNGGQVLFTPIKVIFDDLEQRLEAKISLPHGSPDSGQLAIEARTLCRVQNPPSPRSYPWLSTWRSTSATASGEKLVEIAHSESTIREYSIKTARPSYTNITYSLGDAGPLCDSLSSLPTLTNSPRSPETTQESPQWFGSPGGANRPDAHVEIKTSPSQSPQIVVGKSMDCKIPYLALDEQGGDHTVRITSHNFRLETQSLSQIVPTVRGTVWSKDSRSEPPEARSGPWFSQHQSSKVLEVSPSARSASRTVARLARSNGIVCPQFKASISESLRLTMRAR
jgi:hypothetical protein